MDERTTVKLEQRLRRRHRAERRFRVYGIAAICFGMLCLLVLFTDIIGKGMGAFRQTWIELDVQFDQEVLGISDATDKEQLWSADFEGLLKRNLREQYPDYSGRRDRRALYSVISSDGGFMLRDELARRPELLGQTARIKLLADDDVDVYVKRGADPDDSVSRLRPIGRAVVNDLAEQGRVNTRFNYAFFTNGDSREPELAGIWGAIMGSFLTLIVTLVLAFPIGVAAAVYLEIFAPQNRITDLIEVNINNLAAVPSVIFGLLGLAVFINLFGVPRSVPLVGGMVLALMTLPTIIISSRASIKAVPPSISEAALGMGASKVQTVLHHVLPLAMPGMLTGTIIGMAQALGESAPLLMIGMVAFIMDAPLGVTDPATVLPVQIYLWADSPETSFVEKTSAAIMVLLGFLALMNGAAVYLRKRLERRW